ncbi:MAG: metallophosphatase family protein [Alistipes sp.]|nr:metallophosphatase family protein [Alistipes sp.]MDE7129881.1 metallophosphatase family protein [Alistipes sp.]
MKIGLISDTHSTFDEALEQFLAPVDEIWHAGDIGSQELADRIAAFRPLRAVWGNIDPSAMHRAYDRFASFETGGVQVLMTHIGGWPRHYAPGVVERIQSLRPKIFVCGHSHILRVMYDPVYDLLHINPGAAGNYGCHKVRTAVRFDIIDAEIKNMEIGEWPRRKDCL